MYTGLLHLHSSLRYVILIAVVAALVFSFLKNSKLKLSALIAMIAGHITLLIGLYQWFVGPYGLNDIKNNGMSYVMKNTANRFFAVEHFVGMLLAIILLTIGNRYAKALNYQKSKWVYIAVLVILLVLVPWPFREGLGRNLLPS